MPSRPPQVAALIRSRTPRHPKTSIVVTHDYEPWRPSPTGSTCWIRRRRSLREIERDEWPQLRDAVAAHRRLDEPTAAPACARERLGRHGVAAAMACAGWATSWRARRRVAERVLARRCGCCPLWRHPLWGLRFLLHYLRLVAGPVGLGLPGHQRADRRLRRRPTSCSASCPSPATPSRC